MGAVVFEIFFWVTDGAKAREKAAEPDLAAVAELADVSGCQAGAVVCVADTVGAGVASGRVVGARGVYGFARGAAEDACAFAGGVFGSG